jgi:hypothetical protein
MSQSLSPDQFGGTHKIEHVTVTQVNDMHYKVKVGPGGKLKSKTFKGETAWMDAERHANDALMEQHGFGGPRFML